MNNMSNTESYFVNNLNKTDSSFQILTGIKKIYETKTPERESEEPQKD